MVPQEQQDKWWSDFVVRFNISKGKRNNVNQVCFAYLLENDVGALGYREYNSC